MPLVSVVNGYGTEVSRGVTRPYGYGRGLMQVDPTLYPYTTGQYVPVRVSYSREATMVRTGAERGEPGWLDPEISRGGAAVRMQNFDPENNGGVNQAATRAGQLWTGLGQAKYRGSPLEARQASASPTQVKNEAQAGPTSRSPWRVVKINGKDMLYNTASGKTAPMSRAKELLPAGTSVTGGVVASETATGQRGKSMARAGATPTAPGSSDLKGLSSQHLLDVAAADRAREAAVAQYVNKRSDKWKDPHRTPLGIDTSNDITRWNALGQMTQVLPSMEKRRGNAPDSFARPRGFRGQEKPTMKAYTPTWTQQHANNSYFSLGLYQKPNQAEIINWKRFFDSMGFYKADDWINTGSLNWTASENYAMARFMSVANQDAQNFGTGDPNDLYRLREMMMNGTLSRVGGSGAGGSGAGGSSGPTYPFTQTQTTTSVDLSNLEDARETLRGFLADMIGRNPSDSEVRSYLGRLNAYERKHPTTSTSTTTWKDENTSNTVVSGPRGDNIDPYDITKQYVEGELAPDYKAYQQLRYYSALTDILQSPAGIAKIPQAGV